RHRLPPGAAAPIGCPAGRPVPSSSSPDQSHLAVSAVTRQGQGPARRPSGRPERGPTLGDGRDLTPAAAGRRSTAVPVRSGDAVALAALDTLRSSPGAVAGRSGSVRAFSRQVEVPVAILAHTRRSPVFLAV